MNPIALHRRLPIQFIAAVIVATAALAWHASARAQTAAPPATAAQSSSERGVTVKVIPRAQAPGATEWEFTVVLDTHSENLGDDLTNAALLVADGREIRPIRWTGAQPGGHHREGVLVFPAPGQAATSIELRIQRANETVPRIFRWEGAELR